MKKSIVKNTYTQKIDQVNAPPKKILKPYPIAITKNWGKEIVLVNNELYCGKVLTFKKGGATSTHYHENRDKSLYLLKGSIELHYFNLDNANREIHLLKIGDSIRIPNLIPHKIVAIKDSEIIEISTQDDEENDCYRIEKGDSQMS